MANSEAGVVLGQGAEPTIRDTQIHDGPRDRLLAQPGSAGTIGASRTCRNDVHGIMLAVAAT